MRKKGFIICVLSIGMGGFFLAQQNDKSENRSRVGADLIQQDSLLRRTSDLYNLGEYNEMLSIYETTVPNVTDSFYLAAFRTQKANAFYGMGEYSKAIVWYNKAIEATTTSEEGLGQRGTFLFDRANAEYQLDLLGDCYRSTLASEEILSRLENPDYDYLISVYNDLAYQSRKLAFYDEARKYLRKARILHASKKELIDSYDLPVRKEVAFAYSEILINVDAGDEERMLLALHELESLVDERTDRKSELVRLNSAYGQVADFYINSLNSLSIKKLENARRYLKRSHETLDVKTNPGSVEQLTFNEAKLYYNIGEFQEADRRFDKLLQTCDTADSRIPFFLAMSGLSNLKLGNDIKAKRSIHEMLAFAHHGGQALKHDASNYQPGTNIIHATLFAEIADTIKKYNPSLFESTGKALQTAGIREFEANFEGTTFNERLTRTYESLFAGRLEEDIDEGELSELMNQSERIENRLIWSEFLKNRRHGGLKIPDDVRNEEQLLRMKYVWSRRQSDDQRSFELRKEIEKHERKIAREYPVYGQFSQGNFDVEQLQKQLEKDQLIVKYALFGEDLYRFDISKKQLSFTKLNRDKILDSMHAYEQIIQSREEDLKLANELTTLLLPLDYTSYNRLIVVNHLSLGGIPFETLRDEKGNYLLESKVITYSPHLVFIETEKRGRVDEEKQSLIVFSPNYEESRTLPGAKEEGALLSSRYGGTHFSSNKATREQFLNASNSANVIHLSMHAKINTDESHESCLLFNDSKLYLEELYGLDLNGQMAVLSACNTGKSFEGERLGLASLQRAFIYAGIPATLSSLWEIPDQSTNEIMRLFYENLEKGLTNGEAIQVAKKAYLENIDDPNLRAPYFWAGFVLSGADQKIDIHQNTGAKNVGWIVFTALLMITIVIFFAGLRKRKRLNT